MKNIQKLLAIMVVSIFMASCAKDELTSTATGNLATTDELQQGSNENLLNEDELLQVLKLESNVEERAGAQSMVYSITNEASGNKVIAFNRNADGTISESGRYSTGGTGTDGGLGNQGALAISHNKKFLYVVNPGSNDISVMYINTDGSLQMISKIASGGETPVSITANNGLIYVLNSGGTGNVTGFGFNQQGQIIQIANSTKPLSSSSAGAAQVGFSTNGKVLIITEKATNSITTYNVLYNGKLGVMHNYPSAGTTPFGFDIGNNNRFFVSEAAGGAPGASTVSTYYVDNSGKVSLLDGPLATNETAACWVVATNNKQTLYATNTGSNTVSKINVSGLGNLSMVPGASTVPALTTPIDAAVDQSSKYLYVLVTGNNAIIAYSIGNNGQLTQIGIADQNLPDRMSGLVVK
ncbi:MAG: beta-propeller fold lactonase family protein [Bacteroidetes bacterium]|nr:beta-propeller fold lactonase family protein [Bacteroidota bacterium]